MTDTGWIAVGIGVGYLNAIVLEISPAANIAIMFVLAIFGRFNKAIFGDSHAT